MQKQSQTLTTPRLLLRPTDEQDAAMVLALLNSPKWLQFIGDRKVYDLEAAKAYIRERMLPQLERLGFSNFTIIRQADGAKMGSVGLYDREGLEGVDIGFALLPEFEGQGYAFEASQKVLQTAQDVWGVRVIKAITLPENGASMRLLEKLGLRQKELIRLPNDPDDLWLYELEL
ncbi:MAG: GNAT family N-acetyltransferase [Bacteroidota bacterium]